MSEAALDPHYDAHMASYETTGFWGKAAAGCLFLAKSTGRILIAQRSESVLEPGTWSTWGGAMDPRESPKEAVRREVQEEAGFDIEADLFPLAVFEHESGFRYHNFMAIVDHEFDPVLNSETSSFEWVAMNDISSANFDLHPGMHFLLAHSEEQIRSLINDLCYKSIPKLR